MVFRITRKEILANLISLRFILSLLLVIALFATSGFVFVQKYRQESHDYWKETNKNLAGLSEGAERLYQLAFYEQAVYRKPSQLGLCAEGFEKYLPNRFAFNVFSMEYPEVKSRTNFLVSRFCDLDWAFVVALFVSFMAMLFTYDSICGEREAGTLRLMLAEVSARHNVLLGKYFGAMFTVGISLLVGLLVSLIIVIASKVVDFGISEWLKILAILLVSVLYLSIFVLLGMFVSSRTTHSATSMVVLLFVWVGVAILIPSFGRIVSNAGERIPTEAEMERRRKEVVDQCVDDALSGKYGDSAGNYSPDPDSPSVNPPARARFYNALFDLQNQILEEHQNRMMVQAMIGRRFTCVSPTAIYLRASESVAGTGIRRFSSLRRQIKRYQENLKQFILSKDQEDPDSLHLLFAQENAMENWKAISSEPVDFDTVPQFEEQDLAVGESVRLAIWDICLLALFNMALFAASFVSFLRYDVR